ncbi:ATP-binding protein [Sulfurimonas sp. HSL1-6]|uniref:ATP-binding protein n=1 Tax=Thiomicrolovo immobilis TaxID=3131935 RepID=UPI0031F79479
MQYYKLIITALVAMASLALMAAEPYMNIVVAAGNSKAEMDIYVHTLKRKFAEDPAISEAQAKEHFEVVSRRSGRHYITSVEPLRDSEVVSRVLEKVQRSFPDAYVYTHRGDEVPAAEPEPKVEVKTIYVPAEPEIKTVYIPAAPEVKTVYVDRPSKGIPSEKILIALVILGALLLLLILFALYQKQKLSKISRVLKKEHEELEQMLEHQEDIMVNVGEKIRQPAKEINTSSEKILQTQLDPEQSRELEKIKHSDELLLDITNDLIDFLNLKSDKVKLRHELFNINNVLDEMAGTVSSRARGRGVEFIFDIEKGVPAKFIGDSLRLGQVLTNLMSNAMKFTEAGEVKLHIRRLPDKGGKVMLEFIISDTGIGIDPKRFNDIFEPFSSANDLKETGLGLYISRALIGMMGGAIEIKSVISKGSDFILTIPLEVPDVNEKRHYRLPAKAFTGHSFVIVEVQPTAADALKKMLEYFKNDVSVRSLGAIRNKSDILFESEVVIIAEDAFTPDVQALIKRVKSETDNKVVLAGSMMNEPHDVSGLKSLIDARIMKPLNLQRIYDLIVDLFEDSIKEVDTEGVTPRHTSPKAITEQHYEDVPETPNITKQSFSAFAGASVLIVEDNLINQKVLLSLFNGSGIRVTMAGDGVEALEAVQDPKNRFDLVLMDINMPVMDGYEATRHIRSDAQYDDMPIVSLTGLGLPEEIAKMYALGMNAHLTKPVQVGRLYTVFSRFVKAVAPAAKTPARTATSPLKGTTFANTEVLAAKDGLMRASGDAELYGEILEEYVTLYASADQTLEVFIKTGNFDAAKKLAHDIKGVSANIGATHMVQVSEALNVGLSRNLENSKLLALKSDFDRHLHDVLKEARKYLP